MMPLNGAALSVAELEGKVRCSVVLPLYVLLRTLVCRVVFADAADPPVAA
jgi:hypothetical protein